MVETLEQGCSVARSAGKGGHGDETARRAGGGGSLAGRVVRGSGPKRGKAGQTTRSVVPLARTD